MPIFAKRKFRETKTLGAQAPGVSSFNAIYSNTLLICLSYYLYYITWRR